MKTSKEKFIKWVESLPEDIKIDYASNDNCVVCQFLKDTTGITDVSAGDIYYRFPALTSYKKIPFEDWMIKVLHTAKLYDENNVIYFSSIITKPRLLNAIKDL